MLTLPRFRGRGLGSALLREVEVVAARAGFDALYLITGDAREYYASLGWTVLEPYVVDDPKDVVMWRRV